MLKKQNGSKKANNIILFGTSRTFRTFFDNSDYFWRLPKTSEDSWGLQKIRRLPKLSVYSRRHPKIRILLHIGRNKRLQPPLSTRSEFRSDFSFRFSKSRKELTKYGVTVLVSALRGRDLKFFCPICARNVRNLNHRQKSFWYCETRLWILRKLRVRLFV